MWHYFSSFGLWSGAKARPPPKERKIVLPNELIALTIEHALDLAFQELVKEAVPDVSYRPSQSPYAMEFHRLYNALPGFLAILYKTLDSHDQQVNALIAEVQRREEAHHRWCDKWMNMAGRWRQNLSYHYDCIGCNIFLVRRSELSEVQKQVEVVVQMLMWAEQRQIRSGEVKVTENMEVIR